MNKSVKIVVVLLMLFLVAGAFVALSAAPTRSVQGSPVSGVSKNLPPSLIFNRKLISTSQSYDSAITAVGSSFQPIDAVLGFTCPGPGTCTASAEQNVQVTGSTSGNRWAICTAVDGVFMSEPLCPYQGIVPSDGTFVAGSFVQNQDLVTPGHHTLQTFLYTDLGGSLSIYNMTYRLYKP